VTNQQMGQACPAGAVTSPPTSSALDPQASAAVRRHLGTCPACQTEYEDLVPVLSWLALLNTSAPARRSRHHAVTGGKSRMSRGHLQHHPLEPKCP
jgi:hypothetical protein